MPQPQLSGTGTSYSPPTGGKPQLSGIPYVGGNNELPTWASANPQAAMYGGQGGPIFGGVPYGANNAVPFGQQYADGSPMLRVPMAQRARGEVRSPPRSPRAGSGDGSTRASGGPGSTRASGGPGQGPRLAFDGQTPFGGSNRFGAPLVQQDGRERARYQNPARMAHVISTAHSPAPQGLMNVGNRSSPPPRAGSPLQRLSSPALSQGGQATDLSASTGYTANNLTSMSQPQLQQQGQPYQNQAMLTPRSGSGRHSPGQSPLNSAVPPANAQATQEVDDRSRGRAWAFRSESPNGGKIVERSDVSPAPGYGRQRATSPFGNAGAVLRPGSSSWQVPYAPRQSPNSRLAQSPARGGAITFPRSLSPGLLEASSLTQPGSAAVRAHSPGAAARALSPNGGLAGSTRIDGGAGGFNWAAAPPLSPRGPAPTAGGVSRISSPGNPQVGVSRISSPGGMKPAPQPLIQAGFAWSPEPPSPRTSPRSYSPAPTNIAAPSGMKAGGSLPRWPM